MEKGGWELNMGLISRIKTWVDRDILTHTDLNAEFDNVVGGVNDAVNDTVYGAAWNGEADKAPSQNAVYDKIETLAGGGIYNIVEDTTPQLGGNLDMNGHNIGGNTEAQIDDAVAKKHSESHNIASHSDTTATGAELEELTNGSQTTLHSHAGGGDLPVVDTTGIAKGSVDATKIVRFEVDGLTTGTTRVLTVPNQDITLADNADLHNESHTVVSHSDTTVTGTQLNADHSKLAGIDTGAKDDQTGAEIKTAYQAEANAYTDTKNTKLAGIETGATKYPDTGEQAFLNADHTKLNGIETAATADQTGSEIVTLINAGVDLIDDNNIAASIARDTELHAESHNIASHSDTTATGTQLNTLVGGGDTTLHDHDGISENTAARHNASHTAASHSDITSTGTNIDSAVSLKHSATLIGTKTIDETDIANTKVIAYNSTSGNLEYEAAGTPDAHASTHENAGADEITVTGLSGLLADDQHVLDSEVAGNSAVAANTAKNTNVSTALSVGTVGINTVAITSDGGSDDVTLPAATNTTAGMLTTAKWGEIVDNTAKNTNATHTGEVTGSGALTIAADAVTYAKIQNVSATNKLLGRSTAGSGNVEEISCTAAGRAILADANAAAQRTTLSAAKNATNADITSMTGLNNKGIPEAKVVHTRCVVVKCIADDTALTIGNGKAHFTIPIELTGMNLISVGAHVYTVSSSGSPTFQIHNLTDAQDMLSTVLTIDATEKDSKDAATPAVINTTYDDIVTGDELRFDCDGAGTGAKGMEIRMGFRLP